MRPGSRRSSTAGRKSQQRTMRNWRSTHGSSANKTTRRTSRSSARSAKRSRAGRSTSWPGHFRRRCRWSPAACCSISTPGADRSDLVSKWLNAEPTEATGARAKAAPRPGMTSSASRRCDQVCVHPRRQPAVPHAGFTGHARTFVRRRMAGTMHLAATALRSDRHSRWTASIAPQPRLGATFETGRDAETGFAMTYRPPRRATGYDDHEVSLESDNRTLAIALRNGNSPSCKLVRRTADEHTEVVRRSQRLDRRRLPRQHRNIQPPPALSGLAETMSILIDPTPASSARASPARTAPSIPSRRSPTAPRWSAASRPGKGGQTHLGLPVFDTVAEAKDATGADATRHLRAAALRRRRHPRGDRRRNPAHRLHHRGHPGPRHGQGQARARPARRAAWSGRTAPA